MYSFINLFARLFINVCPNQSEFYIAAGIFNFIKFSPLHFFIFEIIYTDQDILKHYSILIYDDTFCSVYQSNVLPLYNTISIERQILFQIIS